MPALRLKAVFGDADRARGGCLRALGAGNARLGLLIPGLAVGHKNRQGHETLLYEIGEAIRVSRSGYQLLTPPRADLSEP
jgi:hypothetical protein